MKQAEIVREVFNTTSVDELTDGLHSQANVILGYSCREKTNSEPSGILRAVLSRLEIETLNPQSVHKYQSELLAEQMVRNGPNTGFRYSWRNDPVWIRTDLKEYKRPVPDFAIERALQIKRALPTAEFWVEELSLAPDPFLVAHVDDEGYYVAVWEEARFEAGL